MLRREIGATGITCSAIGLGTWAIGGAMWGGSDDAASRAAIAASIDAGTDLIDTAPGYGLGHAESLIGEVIRGRRDRVVIATKCGLNWHHARGTPFFEQYGKQVYRYLGTEGVAHEVEESLRRLATDYIDIYITHWPDSTTPIDETLEALNRLKRDGKIRAIGASNLQPDDLDRYLALGGLDCIQERFSMIDRGIEAEILPSIKGRAVSTISYSPLGMGLLTGKITPDREFPGDDIRKDDPRFSINIRMAVANFAHDLRDLTTDRGVTLSQLIVAWTLQQPQIDFVLCGARKAGHASENAQAGRIALGANDLARIDAAADRHLRRHFQAASG
ncbi:aldo/keto reductase [Paracoccus marinaquae]|uniref:Aldo/keto reductase n=1 Tax=Paracoccus marinaquae TaxID=2841926 RepID=A0ABS6AJH0_9RHOB|nr:aldo/keto reductase [Paracoccus marinaquae]MBU3030735.1 aldo/keto reductase [Paracoccus marinaquae]